MSAKKGSFLTEKEYLELYKRTVEARKKLNARFIKMLDGDLNPADLGKMFLEHLNAFRDDKRKAVAVMDVFYLGLNVRKIYEDMEKEQAKADEELIAKIEILRKKGEVPQS